MAAYGQSPFRCHPPKCPADGNRSLMLSGDYRSSLPFFDELRLHATLACMAGKSADSATDTG